jgi:hypothetical protein
MAQIEYGTRTSTKEPTINWIESEIDLDDDGNNEFELRRVGSWEAVGVLIATCIICDLALNQGKFSREALQTIASL